MTSYKNPVIVYLLTLFLLTFIAFIFQTIQRSELNSRIKELEQQIKTENSKPIIRNYNNSINKCECTCNK